MEHTDVRTDRDRGLYGSVRCSSLCLWSVTYELPSQTRVFPGRLAYRVCSFPFGVGVVMRAAYWISDDRQGEVLLTGPEHATLSDDHLLDVARAEMVKAEITEADGGSIEVGEWKATA